MKISISFKQTIFCPRGWLLYFNGCTLAYFLAQVTLDSRLGEGLVHMQGPRGLTIVLSHLPRYLTEKGTFLIGVFWGWINIDCVYLETIFFHIRQAKLAFNAIS